MSTKRIPTTPRMPWHRPEDRWAFKSECLEWACPSKPVLGNITGTPVWAGDDEHSGPSRVGGRSDAEICASLRRIVAPTKAALARYKREQAAQQRAADKAAKAEAAAKVRAERDGARAIAALPKRARAVVKALNADRSAFGCQRGAVVKLVSALLGCDLGKVVES